MCLAAGTLIAVPHIPQAAQDRQWQKGQVDDAFIKAGGRLFAHFGSCFGTYRAALCNRVKRYQGNKQCNDKQPLFHGAKVQD